jgi:hypothetical protein
MAVQIMASAAGWHEFKKGQPTEDERCKCKLTSRNPCGTNICSCRKMTSIVLLLVETGECSRSYIRFRRRSQCVGRRLLVETLPITLNSTEIS